MSIFAVAFRKRGAKQKSTNLRAPVKLRFLGLLFSPDHTFADELFYFTVVTLTVRNEE